MTVTRAEREVVLEPAAIEAGLGSDKKRRAGKVRWILPTEIGRVIMRDDVPPEAVRAAIVSLAAE